jgi:hypothetical protein
VTDPRKIPHQIGNSGVWERLIEETTTSWDTWRACWYFEEGWDPPVNAWPVEAPSYLGEAFREWLRGHGILIEES